jgi:hypothetical protein
MVEVEIRSPVYDEEAGEVQWRRRALVRAEAEGLTVFTHGDVALRSDVPVLDPATGDAVDPRIDPERWARSLPDAFRAGDLVAVVISDTLASRPPSDEPAADQELPTIPAPPEPAALLVSH